MTREEKIKLKYKNLFETIDNAGGLNNRGGLNSAGIKHLTFPEKMRISFNPWAFLFGIFYFIYVGMWKKGLGLLLIGFLLVVAGQIFLHNNSGTIAANILFGLRANVALYKEYELGQKTWF